MAKSAQQKARGRVFGFPGRPDSGEEMLQKIQEKVGFEEVREGETLATCLLRSEK